MNEPIPAPLSWQETFHACRDAEELRKLSPERIGELFNALLSHLDAAQLAEVEAYIIERHRLAGRA